MRKIVSFRLASDAVATVRDRAERQEKTLSAYLEDLVMSDLSATPSSRPVLIEALRVLRANRNALEKIGVSHAEVFGSVARGEDGPDSDIDILVDLDPAIVRDLFAYSRVNRTLQELLGREVDIAQRGRTRPEMDEDLAMDAVHAF